ncbi:hypothetical protein ROHU_016706 [Labeo rohita]|uniref:Uncharacterized protein n=1 Tax=Labeo rohita TaxID=84645 RepID=A0A498NIS9_LABRO|nr:hypothetical protein ROHU_016706 [Labeo rohita]
MEPPIGRRRRGRARRSTVQGQRWSTGRVQKASGAWSRAFSRIRPGPQPDAQSPRWGQLHSAALAHSRWSGPGGRMLYRSEANACAAFIIADNNRGSFLSDRRMISLVWLTAGRSLKPICMQDDGGTPALGGSLSWCNEESPHRFPVLGRDQLRDISFLEKKKVL